MLIYTNIGISKFVQMHGDVSDIYLPALVFYTQHRVNITIYKKKSLVCKTPIVKVDRNE